MSHKLLLLLALWLLADRAAYGQGASADSLARKLNRYQQAALSEKLFLHLDRPLYLSGETMWLKAYAVDGTSGKPLPLSSVAYVEVLDKQNHPVVQGKIPLKQATGHGSFLLPSSLASGVYTVRAYTSWMQNFGPEYYYHRSVTVVNTTAASGSVATRDTAGYDVQFFPEGGNLVQGLSSKVAFKITAKSGTGAAATGKLLDQNGTTVASFQTLRFGMGSFTFTPAPSATYTAILTLGNRQVIRRKLPRAYEQGYVMHLENSTPTSLTLSISATAGQPEEVFLLGHSRQQVAVATKALLANGRATFTLEKKQLLDGVSHFTLFNAEQKPVCERLYFQPPHDKLAITARSDKSQYANREKVSVDLATTASASQHLEANLSMAVYRLDSLSTASTADINSYLWLASDLKGIIEHPEYYFTANEPDATTVADNLMLTQGWSRFRWEQVLATTPVAFPNLPEFNGPLVRARLTQAGTNKPLKGILTYLSSPSRIIRLQNAVSNADGLVQFELGNLYGSREIMVQTNPQQDSTCRIEVFNPFSSQFATTLGEPFAPQLRFKADYAKRHFQNQVQNAFADKAKNRYTEPPADSTSFYGKADETYFLDKYTRFKVMEEVMREYVPGVMVRIRKDGFHFLVIDRPNKAIFEDNPMVLLDGVPVFNINKIMAMDPLKIQKLEVMASRYFHGSAVYSGLVSYTTYKGDLEGFKLDPRVLVQQYEGLQGQREFYAPRYDTPQAQQSRLPDLRNLLYWNPAITTSTAPTKLDFYTGDQAGRYIVVLQGLASNGLSGSASFTFEVKSAL
ncbi:hypothetical protein [Hymenobacter crusticola]|uniref:Macroglobulin domain-containing protein n=1 Tax=Hymenobacter crusticola TaxID=1770526 RepID=A0A243W940_9BACT|nr:hypothetical protein [Hymenobacter crusticola]OUJ71683.1 hypothetical protein BXP70_21395 [Hymenobacter crusticola]